MTEKKIQDYFIKSNFNTVEIDFLFTKKTLYEILIYGTLGALFLFGSIFCLLRNEYLIFIALAFLGIKIITITTKKLLTPTKKVIVIDKIAKTLTFKKNVFSQITVPFNQISTIKLQNVYTEKYSPSEDSPRTFTTLNTDLIVSTNNDQNLTILTFDLGFSDSTPINEQEKLRTIQTSKEIGKIISETCNVQLEKIKPKKINKT